MDAPASGDSCCSRIASWSCWALMPSPSRKASSCASTSRVYCWKMSWFDKGCSSVSSSVKWNWSTFSRVKSPTAEVNAGKQKKSSMRSKSVAGSMPMGVGGRASAMVVLEGVEASMRRGRADFNLFRGRIETLVETLLASPSPRCTAASSSSWRPWCPLLPPSSPHRPPRRIV